MSIKRYTVTAMNGGHDRSFDSVEDASQYANEILGVNDSLDISITDETGETHLTDPQLEFFKSLPEEPELPNLSINLQIHIPPEAGDSLTVRRR